MINRTEEPPYTEVSLHIEDLTSKIAFEAHHTISSYHLFVEKKITVCDYIKCFTLLHRPVVVADRNRNARVEKHADAMHT